MSENPNSSPEPDTLERAITNLLDNAVKFSPPGATVRVQLEGGVLRVRRGEHLLAALAGALEPGDPAAHFDQHVSRSLEIGPAAGRPVPGDDPGVAIGQGQPALQRRDQSVDRAAGAGVDDEVAAGIDTDGAAAQVPHERDLLDRFRAS